jgi:hypothetical protein
LDQREARLLSDESEWLALKCECTNIDDRCEPSRCSKSQAAVVSLPLVYLVAPSKERGKPLARTVALQRCLCVVVPSSAVLKSRDAKKLMGGEQ